MSDGTLFAIARTYDIDIGEESRSRARNIEAIRQVETSRKETVEARVSGDVC